MTAHRGTASTDGPQPGSGSGALPGPAAPGRFSGRLRAGSWPRTEAEAIAEQQRLRGLVVTAGLPGAFGAACFEGGPEGGLPGGSGAGCLIAGVDVAYDDDRDLVAAAVVLLDGSTLEVVEQATALGRISFPYVPGLLAFREIPSVLAALDRLDRTPDLVVCDGYGVAHPRRLGLASHLGVLTGLPTFGVAKMPFSFSYELPGEERGSWSPLLDLKATDGPESTEGAEGAEGSGGGGAGGGGGGADRLDREEVGRALRTRAGVKPVFVSVGHRIGLAEAVAVTLRLTPSFRLPETTRRADSLCRRALADAVAGMALPAAAADRDDFPE